MRNRVLGVYIKEAKGQGSQSLAYWEEGVFIDLLTTTTKGFDSLEPVMGNPINATHMKDALILYDPTGFFGKLQDTVRSVYLDSRWLRVRLDCALDAYRTHLAELRDAITAADARGIR